MESTLSLTVTDLKAEVGFFLGHGRGSVLPYTDPAWDARQQAAIDSCVKSGTRRFYFAEPVDGVTFDWSFMKPQLSLTLLSGQRQLAMPDDFGGIEGKVTLAVSGQATWYPLDVTGEGVINAALTASPAATGRPRLMAVVPLRLTSAGQGQRFQLLTYPTPDANYVIQFNYYVNPDAMDLSNPFSYGGLPHAETILESCLAVAEERLDDSSTVHAERFRSRLLTSMAMDRRLKPQLLGYNGDRSDGRVHGRDGYHGGGQISVNGVVY